MTKNLIIWWSMRWWKTESTNWIFKALHWDDIRKDVLATLWPLEQNLLLPKYSRYLKWEFTFEELLRNLTTDDYLRVEQYESWVVYDRWIEQIIQSWISEWKWWNIIEWVQLLPEKLIDTLKWKEDMFNVVYLVKTNMDKVLSFINDSLDKWDISTVWTNFVSWSLKTPLLNDYALRITFADLIVAYWKEVSYVAKENWFRVIETSWDKKIWLGKIFNNQKQ